jgi:hypothetical protein
VVEGDLKLMNEMKNIQTSSSPQGRQHLLVAAPFVQMIFSVALSDEIFQMSSNATWQFRCMERCFETSRTGEMVMAISK